MASSRDRDYQQYDEDDEIRYTKEERKRERHREKERRRREELRRRRRSSSEVERESIDGSLNICQRYITLVLAFVFFASLLLAGAEYYFLIASFHTDDKYKIDLMMSLSCVFACSNGMLMNRLVPVNWCTGTLHALLNIYIPPCYGYLIYRSNFRREHGSYFELMPYVILFTCVVTILQCLAAFHLVVFRPGRSSKEKSTRSGIHAFFGILILFLLVFNHHVLLSKMGKHLDEKVMSSVLVYYLLPVFFIMLTPYFEHDLRERIREKAEAAGYRDPQFFK